MPLRKDYSNTYHKLNSKFRDISENFDVPMGRMILHK